MNDDDLVERDLECAVCMALLCEPVDWPGACNHSFCRLCLLRLHTLAAFRCPMCRCPCSSPSTTVTLAQISRWPVSYERRCLAETHEYDHDKPSSYPTTRAPTVRRARARAAAPEQYRRRSRDHELKSALLLRGSTKKGVFWKELRSRAAGYSFMPGPEWLHALARCWLGINFPL